MSNVSMDFDLTDLTKQKLYPCKDWNFPKENEKVAKISHLCFEQIVI